MTMTDPFQLKDAKALGLDGTPLNQLLDLPREFYDADRTGVRKGWLDLIAEHSPAHLQAYLRGEDVEARTEPLEFGQVLHTFVLEAHLIDSRYYREPEVDRRTNVGKAKLAEAAAANAGKRGVRAEKWDLGLKLRDAVYAHRAARALLEADGGFEQTMFWDNTETGERCKALYDKTSVGKAFHADLKSTTDASEPAFRRAIWNYAYDRQGAHYCDATGLRFVLIAVEKTPPYAVAVYALDDWWMQSGQERRMPHLRTYAHCRATGKWPSYPDKIQHIGHERWMKP